MQPVKEENNNNSGNTLRTVIIRDTFMISLLCFKEFVNGKNNIAEIKQFR